MPRSAVAAADDKAAGAPGWSVRRWLAAGWLTGAALAFGVAIDRAVKTARLLRSAWEIHEGGARALLDACRREAGVRRRVGLFACEALASPAVTGAIRPRIYLPPGAVGNLDPSELRHIFLHELGHVRRGDAAVAWLPEHAAALHWFNPLAWLARRLQRDDRELACDEFALRRLGAEGGRDYGRTLLKVAAMLRASGSPAPAVPALAMARCASDVPARIRRIAGRRQPGRGSHAAAALAVAGAALLGATAAPTGGGSKPDAPFPLDGPLPPNHARLQIAVIAAAPADPSLAEILAALPDDEKPAAVPAPKFAESTVPFAFDALPDGKTEVIAIDPPAGIDAGMKYLVLIKAAVVAAK
ncbi:MAG: M56 family metallopeptidase [Verrucomicrobiales bacterium]